MSYFETVSPINIIIWINCARARVRVYARTCALRSWRRPVHIRTARRHVFMVLDYLVTTGRNAVVCHRPICIKCRPARIIRRPQRPRLLRFIPVWTILLIIHGQFMILLFIFFFFHEIFNILFYYCTVTILYVTCARGGLRDAYWIFYNVYGVHHDVLMLKQC